MTCVAWDGHTLAGDTQCTRSALRSRVDTKVWRIVHAGNVLLLGCSGVYTDALRVREWIEAGGAEDSKPALTPSEDSGPCILIQHGKALVLEWSLFPIAIVEPFFAIGSGRDYAMAAMHCGRTAREAVEIACEYDIYSSGPITEVSLE